MFMGAPASTRNVKFRTEASYHTTAAAINSNWAAVRKLATTLCTMIPTSCLGCGIGNRGMPQPIRLR
jgi:hypothetical protein